MTFDPKTRLFTTLLATCISFISYAQNCSCISGGKNNADGRSTVGGITRSADHYSLLFQKTFDRKNTAESPTYTLFLHAAARVQFSDSMLQTKGTITLIHADMSTTILTGVTYSNSPLGLYPSLGFTAALTEDQVRAIAKNPIGTLMVNKNMATTFKDRKQLEQQKILSCLLQRQ